MPTSIAKPVRLAVWDLDNTLTDTLDVWARGMAMVISEMEGSFNVEREALRAAIHRAAAQHRFGDYGGLSHFLKKEGIPKRGETLSEQYNIDAARRAIRNRFFQIQKDGTTFYDGAAETVAAISSKGAAQVIYSDTEAPSLIRRLWHLTLNSGIDITDHIDAFYTMPSFEDDRNLLRDIDPHFIHAVKAKLVIGGDGRRKAYPERMQAIMDDFGASPCETLMIGDSDKDAGCALPLGVRFAFYHPGTKASEETLEILTGYASPNYSYGTQTITDRIDRVADGRPYAVIEETLTELFSRFAFAEARSSYRHSPASEAIHIPLISGSTDRIPPRSRTEYARFGRASHLLPSPPAMPLSDLSGTADRGTPDPLAPVFRMRIPA